MKDLLKNAFLKAEKEYMVFLHNEFKSQISRLELLINKVIDDGDDVDETFEDFDIRLVTDSSYSDYHNHITFMCIRNKKISTGSGIWDCEYDYGSFDIEDLPSEISDLEYILEKLTKEIDCYSENIL